jgi:hypothetical protein
MASDFVEAGKVILEYATRPRYSFVIWTVCLLLLFLPTCGITVFVYWRDAFENYLWLIWLSAFGVWSVEISLLLFKTYTDWRSERGKEEEILAHVQTLSYHEARLLVSAIERNTQTVIARKDMDEGFLLREKRLLQTVNTDGKTGVFGGTPYFIPTFVWDHITTPGTQAVLKAILAKVEKPKPT